LKDSDPFETFVKSLNETLIPLARLYLLYKNVDNVSYKNFIKLVKKHELEITWEKDSHWKKVVILPHARKNVAISSP